MDEDVLARTEPSRQNRIIARVPVRHIRQRPPQMALDKQGDIQQGPLQLGVDTVDHFTWAHGRRTGSSGDRLPNQPSLGATRRYSVVKLGFQFATRHSHFLSTTPSFELQYQGKEHEVLHRSGEFVRYTVIYLLSAKKKMIPSFRPALISGETTQSGWTAGRCVSRKGAPIICPCVHAVVRVEEAPSEE